MSLPLDSLKNALSNMTPETRKKLIENYLKLNRLKTFCVAQKYVELLPRFSGIKVLKNTIEVKELKKVIDILKPGGFKWQAK